MGWIKGCKCFICIKAKLTRKEQRMAKRPDEIKLGDKVKCSISGFTGTVTSRIEYINGCVQYGVAPEVDKDGKLQPTEYFDFQRLEVTQPMASVHPMRAAAKGGPQQGTPSGNYRG